MTMTNNTEINDNINCDLDVNISDVNPTQINFSFSKGDDNYGGIQRKELDDFCKSLGKQMNLVLYRWDDDQG